MVDQIDEVKQKTDIVPIISGYVELKKAGRNYKANCPFHSEKTASFMVSPELQIYKCFGCGESGDVFTFLEKYEGMEFGEALRLLADKAGVKLASYNLDQKGLKEHLFEVNNHLVSFYRYFLLKHNLGKTALKYLTVKRDLRMETINQFKIGYSPENPLVMKKYCSDKKITVEDIEQVGIGYAKGNRLIDRFRGRIIFPLFDHRGNIAGFSGRVLPERDNGEMAKYINTPETDIYHKGSLLYGLNITRDEIKKDKEVIVVEGEFDLISLWQAGFKNVVAIKGSALTENQVRIIKRFAEKIILSLDSDLAGDLAAHRGIAVAANSGLEIRVLTLKDFKDPDEAVKSNPDSFSQALKQTTNAWDYLIDSIFAKENEETGEGKAKISRAIAPVLNLIEDQIVQAHYIRLVAKKLAVPEEAVYEQINEYQKQGKEKEIFIKKELDPRTPERRVMLEESLLLLAFQFRPEILREETVRSLFTTLLCRRLIEAYEIYLTKEKDFEPKKFSLTLTSELLDGFSRMMLENTEKFGDDPGFIEREIEVVKKDIRVLDLKDKLKVITKDIYSGEKAGDKVKLKEAEVEFGRLSKELSELEGKHS